MAIPESTRELIKSATLVCERAEASLARLERETAELRAMRLGMEAVAQPGPALRLVKGGKDDHDA